MDADKIGTLLRKIDNRVKLTGDPLFIIAADLIRDLRTECASQEVRIAKLEEALQTVATAMDGAAADLVGSCKDPELAFIAEALQRICDAKIAALASIGRKVT